MKYFVSTSGFMLCLLIAGLMLPPQAMAAEGDGLDIFEESAYPASLLECDSLRIVTAKNIPVSGTLPYRADGGVSFVITKEPQLGSVSIDSGGNFVYTPSSNVSGEDGFSFRAVNGSEESNIAFCSVEIREKTEEKPSPSSFRYADMAGHWGEYAAVKLVERDIIKGERIGSKYYFYPDKQMQRIDVLGMLVSALGGDDISVDGKNTHIFADSASLPDHVNNIAYRAYKLGLTEGRGDGEDAYLEPYGYVTRAELMKLIDRAMGAKTVSEVPVSLIDMRSVPDWAVQSVKNIVGSGIASGYDDSTLRPYESVTKAQAAQMIYQLVKFNEENSVPTASKRALFYEQALI